MHGRDNTIKKYIWTSHTRLKVEYYIMLKKQDNKNMVYLKWNIISC